MARHDEARRGREVSEMPAATDIQNTLDGNTTQATPEKPASPLNENLTPCAIG
jgi:hypothetical protein